MITDAKVHPDTLKIFLDESGDDVSYAIAGLVGAQENWDGFRDDWNAVMEKHGLPNVALHMKELQNSPKEPWVSFRTAPNRIQALLGDLADVIIAHKLAAFGAVLLMHEYNALSPEGKKRWPNPYKLCFETTLAAADATCDPAPTATICLTFDNGCNEGWAKQAYAKLKKNTPSKAFADEAAFEDDQSFPELCAADMIAYELRRAFYNYFIHGRNELRPSFQKLMQKTPYVFWKVVFDNVIDASKVVDFAGTKDAVAEILLYQDDPRP